jgi:hypothetical protein
VVVERLGYVGRLFPAPRRRDGRRVRLGKLIPDGNFSPPRLGNRYRPFAQRPDRLHVQLRRKGPEIGGILGTLSRPCARWVTFPRYLPTVRPVNVAAREPYRWGVGGCPVHRAGTGFLGRTGRFQLAPPSTAIARLPGLGSGCGNGCALFRQGRHARSSWPRQLRRTRQRNQPGGRGPSRCCASRPEPARGRRKPSSNS